MIKNLTAYRNKWAPKYYWASNSVIFNINTKNDEDGCGIQVIDTTKTGDELGQDACEKACGIVIEFLLPNRDTKTLYFPLQYLVGEGDLIAGRGDVKYFVQHHPVDFIRENFYMSKFLKPIDEEIIKQAIAGKKAVDTFNALPAWLTTPSRTENVSINDFVKGVLKTYESDNIPANVEIGTLMYVQFYYKTDDGTQKKINLNTYTKNIVEDIFRSQIALIGVSYINNKLGKQLNSELTQESVESITGMTIKLLEETEGGTPSGKLEQVVIAHNDNGMTISPVHFEPLPTDDDTLEQSV